MSDYEAQVEAVRDRYSDRILAILGGIRDAVREAGFQCDEPEPTHGDRFEWSFGAGRTKPTDTFVNLSIAEEPDYVGEGTGITFHLTVLENGGRVLGEFSPFNFTPQVCGSTWPTATHSRIGSPGLRASTRPRQQRG